MSDNLFCMCCARVIVSLHCDLVFCLLCKDISLGFLIMPNYILFLLVSARFFFSQFSERFAIPSTLLLIAFHVNV